YCGLERIGATARSKIQSVGAGRRAEARRSDASAESHADRRQIRAGRVQHRRPARTGRNHSAHPESAAGVRITLYLLGNQLLAATLAQVSRRVTVRLKTGLPSRLSGSTQK